MSEENKKSGSDQPTPKKKKSSQEEFPLQEYRLVPVEEWEEEGNSENEIDLIELGKHVWDNRSTIYKFLAVGIVLGLAVAFFSPKEYRTGATLMPEVQSSEGGASRLLQQYGGLLGMSGSIDLNSNGMIPPQLYPQIVQSLPFQIELLNSEVEFPRFDTSITVYAFFDEIYVPSVFSYIIQYTVGLPGKIVDLFKTDVASSSSPRGFETDSVITVTLDQMKIIEDMRSRISVSLDEETGVIDLSVIMPDPNAAAQLAQKSINLMREYVINYRTKKAEQDLKFAREQMEIAKSDFEDTQNKLAEFRDSNFNLSTARAETQQQRLQSEYDLAFNVYNTLAQQVEQAKLKVQEQTPVLSILQPVQVPVNDNKSGALVLIIFIMLSITISISWLFIEKFLIPDNWVNQN